MSVFGIILVRIFPAFFRIRTKYGKNADWINFEYGRFIYLFIYLFIY